MVALTSEQCHLSEVAARKVASHKRTGLITTKSISVPWPDCVCEIKRRVLLLIVTTKKPGIKSKLKNPGDR